MVRSARISKTFVHSFISVYRGAYVPQRMYWGQKSTLLNQFSTFLWVLNIKFRLSEQQVPLSMEPSCQLSKDTLHSDLKGPLVILRNMERWFGQEAALWWMVEYHLGYTLCGLWYYSERGGEMFKILWCFAQLWSIYIFLSLPDLFISFPKGTVKCVTKGISRSR